MGEIILFGLKNCDTCKKALKTLSAAGLEVHFVDIRAGADLAEKVPAWLLAVGAEALVNKRSTTWRGLGGVERDKADDERAASLLIDNPTLIKRPVIESGDQVHVGWTEIVRGKIL
jgi:arsenate reductase